MSQHLFPVKVTSAETMSIQTWLKELFQNEYYSKKYVREGIPDALNLHVPIFAKKFPCAAQAFDLEEKILDKISAPFGDEGTLSTLILGDSGTGKSWLAHKVTKSLFETLDRNLRIPLYIPLRAVEEASCERSSDCKGTYRYNSICLTCRKAKNILYAYLTLHSTNATQIEQMYRDLQKCELILFLDGYDELQNKVNLWTVNRDWDKYRVRTFVFGRSTSLLNLDISDLFKFCKGDKRRVAVQYVITPLEDKLVEAYVQNVPQFLRGIDLEKCRSEVSDPWVMTKKAIVDARNQVKGEGVRNWESNELECSEYHYWFYKVLPELQGLSRNVYILTMICQTLPIMVEAKRRDNSDLDKIASVLKQICETEVGIYDEFTRAWVSYQVNKIKEAGEANGLNKISDVLKFYMFAYAQNLAILCISSKAGAIFNGSMHEGMTESWNLWAPLESYYSKDSKDSKDLKDFKVPKDLEEPEFKRDSKLERELFPRDDQDEDEGRLKNLRSLRSASLLRYDKESKTFEFFHLSLLEYFASRDIFVNLRAHLNFYINYDRGKKTYFLVNQNRLFDQKFQGILSMVVDKAKKDINFQNILLESVKKSAEIPGIEIMASNAMTILNFSLYNFSGNQTDFRNIQVPFVNLRKAICGNSDFSGANFEGASLSEGWFQNCRFQGSNFKNCHFGGHCPTDLGSEAWLHDMVCYRKVGEDSQKGLYHVVLCRTKDVQNEPKLYCKNFKFSKKFRCMDSKEVDVAHNHSFSSEEFQHLINASGNVYLLILTKTFLNEETYAYVPTKLWEVKFSSIVPICDINVNAWKSVAFASNTFQKRFVILGKFPVFVTETEFSQRCIEQTFDADFDRTIYITRFSWLPMGPFKLLIGILFELSIKYNAMSTTHTSLTEESVKEIKFKHNATPIVTERGQESFEIWWGCTECFKMETVSNLWFSRIVFDGRSVLSVNNVKYLEVGQHDRNVFFLDLHKSVRIPYVRRAEPVQNATRKRLVYSEQGVALWHDDEVTMEFKTSYGSYSLEYIYSFSEDLNYVAQGKVKSIDIMNTTTRVVERRLLCDMGSPFCFVTSLDGKTNFLYIYGNALCFIQFSSDLSRVTFGLDAKLGKVVGSQVAALEGLIESEEDMTRDTRTHSPWAVREAMVTKSGFVMCKAYHNRDTMGYKLLAFANDGKETELLGVPCNNSFEFETNSFFFHFLRLHERIIVGEEDHFSVYKIQEPNIPDTAQHRSVVYIRSTERILELVKLSSASFDGSMLSFAGQEKLRAVQNGVYLVPQAVRGKLEYVVHWDVEADSSTKLRIEYPENMVSSSTCRKACTSCCFQCYDEILLGHVDLEQSNFYVTNVLNTSNHFLELKKVSGTILYAELSPELHWVSILTSVGEMVILDSDNLKHMFSYRGFNKGAEFHVENPEDESKVHIVIWTKSGHVTQLEINATSLRKCFSQHKVDNFRDWRVEKFESPGTTLSLHGTDIGGVRGLDTGNLEFLKYFESRGDPSDEWYVPFCSLFEPVTDSGESMLSPFGAGQGGSVDLSKTWTVTVIVKKSELFGWATSDWHSALVLEGIHYNRHFVIRAELVLKEGAGSLGVLLQGSTETHRVKVESLGAGNKSGYLEIVNNYYASQFQASSDLGMKLLKNIWGDTRQKWSYSVLNSNCNTWCERKLALIGYKFPRNNKFSNFLHLPTKFF